MNGRSGRFLLPLSALILAAALGGCGGGGGGDDDGNVQDALGPITPTPPPTLGLSFDDQSFAEVAGSGDVAAVLGNATIDSSSAPDDQTVTAAAAAINLALGSTRIFSVLRDGGDALTSASLGSVRSSSIQIDVDRFELDWDPEEDAGGLLKPGAWNVFIDFLGGAKIDLFVQFEDGGSRKITKSFGDTRTNVVRVAMKTGQLGFVGVNFVTFEDVSWTISDFRDEGDVITVNGGGTVELDLKLLPQDVKYDFDATNLRLDFANFDAFRRPDSGEVHLRANNVLPLGEDLDFFVTFAGSNDATVVVKAPLCDLELDWSLSSGLPEEFPEIRDCL